VKKNGKHAAPPEPPKGGFWVGTWRGITVRVMGNENRWFLAREKARQRFSKITRGQVINESEIVMEWQP
jgi:hypothetical protein